MTYSVLHFVFGVSGWGIILRIATVAFVAGCLVRLLPASIYPRRSTRLGWMAAIALVAAVATLGWDASVYMNMKADAARQADKLVAPSEAAMTGPPGKLKASPDSYLGVYEPGEVGSYQPVSNFASQIGRNPNVLLYYSTITTPFQSIFAERAQQNGAVPLIQLNPGSASMQDVADGREDSYLKSFAEQLRSFGHPVILAFASEPDGTWYNWGYTHTSPSVWIAGWRHTVTVFRQAGADNVTWLWTVNAELGSATGPLSDWWPGSQYVTWVGIDGYYFQSNATFTSVFASTIHDIHAFTSDPILISEVAIGPVAGSSKIAGLVQGVENNNLLGFVWYDQKQTGSIYHQDWRLEDSPAAMAAFRTAVKTYK